VSFVEIAVVDSRSIYKWNADHIIGSLKKDATGLAGLFGQQGGFKV